MEKHPSTTNASPANRVYANFYLLEIFSTQFNALFLGNAGARCTREHQTTPTPWLWLLAVLASEKMRRNTWTLGSVAGTPSSETRSAVVWAWAVEWSTCTTVQCFPCSHRHEQDACLHCLPDESPPGNEIREKGKRIVLAWLFRPLLVCIHWTKSTFFSTYRCLAR